MAKTKKGNPPPAPVSLEQLGRLVHKVTNPPPKPVKKETVGKKKDTS